MNLGALPYRPEPLPLSLLNDFLYCPPRAGLKVIEGWWGDNQHRSRKARWPAPQGPPRVLASPHRAGPQIERRLAPGILRYTQLGCQPLLVIVGGTSWM